MPAEWVDRLPVERLLPHLRAVVRAMDAHADTRRARRAENFRRDRTRAAGELHAGCRVRLAAAACKEERDWAQPRYVLRPGEEGEVVTLSLCGGQAEVAGPRGSGTMSAALLAVTAAAAPPAGDRAEEGPPSELPAPPPLPQDDYD